MSVTVDMPGHHAEISANIAGWQAELGGLDPRSYEYEQLSRAIAELAIEVGLPPLSPDTSGDVAKPPPAFAAAIALDGLFEVPADQFKIVPPLCKRGDVYKVPGVELTDDGGRQVRLLDLRPQLIDRLDDVIPAPHDADRLDHHFYHDLRLFLERHKARNTVHRNGSGGSGPHYTRVVGVKSRAFWNPVRVVEREGKHLLTVARIADCGVDPKDEVTLYRRLFGMTMRGIK